MLALYEDGKDSTSGLILRVGGHPAAVIDTIRMLEALGVLTRTRMSVGRHQVQACLTPLGRELVENPVCLWVGIAGERIAAQ